MNYTDKINKIQETGENRTFLYKEVCFTISEEIKKVDKSNLGFIRKQFVEEAIMNYQKAMNTDEEFMVYSYAYKSALYADKFFEHAAKY